MLSALLHLAPWCQLQLIFTKYVTCIISAVKCHMVLYSAVRCCTALHFDALIALKANFAHYAQRGIGLSRPSPWKSPSSCLDGLFLNAFGLGASTVRWSHRFHLLTTIYVKMPSDIPGAPSFPKFQTVNYLSCFHP